MRELTGALARRRGPIAPRSFVSVDDGIAEAARPAAEAGAAIIAAHPNEPASSSGRLTRRFACDAGCAGHTPIQAVQQDAALQLGRRHRGFPQ